MFRGRAHTGKEGIMIVRCMKCGEFLDMEDTEFAPDPFNLDIHGDDTNVWECAECRKASAEEI